MGVVIMEVDRECDFLNEKADRRVRLEELDGGLQLLQRSDSQISEKMVASTRQEGIACKRETP